MASSWRRWAVVAGSIPLGLLLGCPQQNVGSPAGASAKVTAPAASVPGTAAPGNSPPTATTAAQTQSPAQVQRDQELIARVEGAYSSGVTNYRAGRLDSARADFDSAVDLLLASGTNLKTDAQLADEFEHVVNPINSLEMSAVKQGNGFSAPIEAAPLDAADEVTFPANPALTAKVKDELKTTQSDFPLVANDYVAGFISYFSNSPAGHAHLLRSLERAGKYKDMISGILRQEGVPQDLIYLAVAESGFQPQALNAVPVPAACGSSCLREPMASAEADGSTSVSIQRSRRAPMRGTSSRSTTSSAIGISPWPPTTGALDTCSVP